MPALVDARPAGIDLLFRPGTTLTLTLNWPAGSLAGRTFSSTLNGVTLTLGVVDDVMTISASVAQTAAITAAADWVLTETTGDDQPIMVGTWAPSAHASAVSSTTVNVTQGQVQVDVRADGFLLGDDLTLPLATFPGDGTVDGGVIRRVHSVQVPWTYTQVTDPLDPAESAFGTAFHVNAQVTLDYTGQTFVGPKFSTGHFGPRGVYNFEGLVRYAKNTGIFGLLPLGYVDTLAVANNAGAARNLTPAWSFLSARQLIADGATITLIANDANAGGAAFADHVLWASVDGGSISGGGTCGITSFHSQPALMGNISLHHRIGLDIEGIASIDIGGSPYPFESVGVVDEPNVTLTEEVGVRVGAFTNAQTAIGLDIAQHQATVTNIGIRNASTEVATPSVQTLSAAGNSIVANAKVKRLNNTSGGPLTLTSTPTIADGQNGQILVLFNSSANAVTLQHGTTFNLRLVGGVNRTLNQGDSITLMFSSDLSDWIQL